MSFFRPQIPPLPQQEKPALESIVCRFKDAPPPEPAAPPTVCRFEKYEPPPREEVRAAPQAAQPCLYQVLDNYAIVRELRLQSMVIATFTVVNLIVLAILTFK